MGIEKSIPVFLSVNISDDGLFTIKHIKKGS